MDIATLSPAILPRHRDLFYGGGWHAPLAGQYAESHNPATGEAIGPAALADADDIDAAVRAAHGAFTAWRKMMPAARGAMLREAAGILRREAQALAMLDAMDTGNPVTMLAGDAHFAAAGLDYFSGLTGEIKGETIPMGDSNLNYTIREPLGVVARIVAYNHPLMFAAMRIAAPLAAGNTVVVKAPDQAPLSLLRLAELIGEIFPAGVVNFVTGGQTCGKALVEHPLVRKVTLIGGVPTGKAVMRGAAETLKPVLLELGGKNALIAYPDADIEALINGVVQGMNFTWAGQSCGSTSRVFLHASIHDRVLEAVARLVPQRHKPGKPTDPATTMGALISARQLEKVEGFVASALADGARLICGGRRPADPELARGFFYEATVFADVTPEMRLAREEVFGPIMSVFRWEDEDALFDQVNALDFGLTGSIWTRDLDIAHRAARRLESGYIWINNTSQHFIGAPFGGVKQSGIGREECFEELLEFTQVKNVNLRLSSD
jgi:betaine-aldehyde dehydrogenase